MIKQEGKHYICLTCWEFATLTQQRQHQKMQHQCATPGSVKDAQSFLHIANVFGKVLPNGGQVVLFAPQQDGFVNKFNLPYKDVPCLTPDHYENRLLMHIKGTPPLLCNPLVPINMIPYAGSCYHEVYNEVPN